MTGKRIAIYLSFIATLLIAVLAWYVWAFLLQKRNASSGFDGVRALADVQIQVAFGPRIPGSISHARTVDWIRQRLESAGWQVEIQSAESMGHPIRNIRAYRSAMPPQFILGAHYDSRIYADEDPDPSKRTLPVPGAEDGASGVAVLLELARTLPRSAVSVWLVFFDAEDNGGISGWDWCLGSQAFVQDLRARPRGMVLLDMVGDGHLSLPMEANSDPALRASIWETANRLGHGDIFVPRLGPAIEDDHVPFLQAGIPAVDIIDLDYRYWHSTSDTPDHVSARSLQIVGEVVSTWLLVQDP